MGKKAILNLLAKVSLLLVMLGIFSVCEAKIIYVDDSASGAMDGSSWTDAYIYLQDALGEASSGDEIRVAHGVYTPDMGTGYTAGDINAAFQLKNGVTIKGGYVGLDIPEKSDERAFHIFETILSNDLNGEDDPNIPSSYFSSEIIVTGSNTDETAVLDGFTIGRKSSGMSVGSCMHINSGSPTILNCIFIKKELLLTSSSKSLFTNRNGSSPTIIACRFESSLSSSSPLPYSYSINPIMANHQSSPVLMNCTFKNNSLCMSNIVSNVELNNCVFQGNLCTSIEQNRGSLTISGCTFSENPMSWPPMGRFFETSCVVNYNGVLIIKDSTFTGNSFNLSSSPVDIGSGCIYNRKGNLKVTGCTFSGNSSDFGCECIYNDKGNLMVTGCTFFGNSNNFSDLGDLGDLDFSHGCIYNDKGDFMVTGCTFSGNSGGAIQSYLVNSANATIKNCDFINNSYRAISSSKLIIENCRFSGNSAIFAGVIKSSESDIHNCIFEANTGTSISINPGVYRELYNCIFYGNSANVVNNTNHSRILNLTNCIIRNNDSNVIDESMINVTYSNVEGGCSGEGNIDIDPVFVRAGYWADVNNPDIVVEKDDPNAIWIMGDYHLKSQAGRWDVESESWVKDSVSSPCIDAGNMNSPIGFEPYPNGGVSNLGAYGRSNEASKTYFEDSDCDVILAADINGDSVVDYYDLNIVISQWLLEGHDFINRPPVVTLIEPQDGDQITYPGEIQLKAQAFDTDGEIDQVIFQIERQTDTSSMTIGTYSRKEGDFWVGRSITGNHDLEYGEWTASAVATDNEGAITESKVSITLVAP
ncbi:MAG: right-handed parallel beta-helix repeat-containing protein [Sedimentisphaerales bacterium]|nr:right-handed parallel beta-helix repeat-containing protein [Sedimentisphaerales bacterium]